MAAPAADSRQLRDCRVVHVFDVKQVEGEPLPDLAPALLTGQAPAGLWDELAAQVTGRHACQPSAPDMTKGHLLRGDGPGGCLGGTART